jgi:hypothetical protein
MEVLATIIYELLFRSTPPSWSNYRPNYNNTRSRMGPVVLPQLRSYDLEFVSSRSFYPYLTERQNDVTPLMYLLPVFGSE